MSTHIRLVVAALLVGGLTACGGQAATTEITPVEQKVEAPAQRHPLSERPAIRDRQSLERCELASVCAR